MLLNVLLMLPNNYSSELMEGRWPTATPGLVRRAEEFLEGNATEPVAISDVVAVCGCSRRRLFEKPLAVRMPCEVLRDSAASIRGTAVVKTSRMSTSPSLDPHAAPHGDRLR
jgi:hypothetical protein